MSGNFRVIILGSGSSGGVPRFGGKDGFGDWGTCDPLEPKNRRTRCSILIQREHPKFGYQHNKVTSVLVDTSPDMRAQLLAAQCSRLDAVLFTHDHADQSHGIDDLRVFALQMQQRIPVFIDEETSGHLLDRFRYCFEQAPGSPYRPILDKHKMPSCGETFTVDGPSGEIPIVPFLQFHGSVNSLGFRIGDVAYSSDVVGLPDESFKTIDGVNCWILDALQRKPHSTHAHLDMSLEWLRRVTPDLGVLTNLHVTMDYASLRDELPAGVVPAYDGMVLSGNI